MAAASGGLIFINGVGAVLGPVILGRMMDLWGPNAFFAYLAGIMAAISIYAAYRMTRRPLPEAHETTSYAPVTPAASPVAVNVAQEIAIDLVLEEESNTPDPNGDAT